ncbi:MAG: hypothetical protein KF868_10735, partial [Acidobacteria bacterium]|nr:hypothetical protein [Acidobacteriota bacterium]
SGERSVAWCVSARSAGEKRPSPERAKDLPPPPGLTWFLHTHPGLAALGYRSFAAAAAEKLKELD